MTLKIKTHKKELHKSMTNKISDNVEYALLFPRNIIQHNIVCLITHNKII